MKRSTQTLMQHKAVLKMAWMMFHNSRRMFFSVLSLCGLLLLGIGAIAIGKFKLALLILGIAVTYAVFIHFLYVFIITSVCQGSSHALLAPNMHRVLKQTFVVVFLTSTSVLGVLLGVALPITYKLSELINPRLFLASIALTTLYCTFFVSGLVRPKLWLILMIFGLTPLGQNIFFGINTFILTEPLLSGFTTMTTEPGIAITNAVLCIAIIVFATYLLVLAMFSGKPEAKTMRADVTKLYGINPAEKFEFYQNKHANKSKLSWRNKWLAFWWRAVGSKKPPVARLQYGFGLFWTINNALIFQIIVGAIYIAYALIVGGLFHNQKLYNALISNLMVYLIFQVHPLSGFLKFLNRCQQEQALIRLLPGAPNLRDSMHWLANRIARLIVANFLIAIAFLSIYMWSINASHDTARLFLIGLVACFAQELAWALIDPNLWQNNKGWDAVSSFWKIMGVIAIYTLLSFSHEALVIAIGVAYLLMAWILYRRRVSDKRGLPLGNFV